MLKKENHQWHTDSLANVASDAVGVSSRKWFIAIVNTNTEISSRERLLSEGYEARVASQFETHLWRNGRRYKSEHILIPLTLFVHATEEERREIISYPFIKKFMTDKAQVANNYGVHPFAVVPDHEMDMLQFMLYQSDTAVKFSSRPIRQGSKIRVVRGSLRGFEGHITRYHDNDAYAVANIGILGCAMVKISLCDIESLT